MRKAAKVFIWIGMICEFFLIFPIIVGIMSLKKINRATSRAELQDFGIITLLFCSVLGGFFMLCMEDADCKPVQNIEKSSEELTAGVSKTESQPIKEPLTEEQILERKRKKTKLALKILGIIFASITFVLSLVFFFLTLSCVWVRGYYYYEDKGIEIKPYHDPDFTLFLILTILFLVLTLVLAYLILRLYDCKKKLKIIGISVLVGIYAVVSLIALPVKISRVQDDIDIEKSVQVQVKEKQEQEEAAEKERKTLKYTEVSIEEFLKDAKRYPSRYNGNNIVLEGYVYNAGLNTFDLVFPYPSYASSYSSYYSDASYVSVEYVYDSTHPRVLNGDYVVIAGVVEITTSGNSMTIKITGATCEIKN